MALENAKQVGATLRFSMKIEKSDDQAQPAEETGNADHVKEAAFPI